MSGKELAGTPLGRVKVGALSKIPDDGVPTHTYRVTVGEDDTATRERLHALLESIANDQTPPTKDGGARDEELNQLSFLPFKVDRDHESAYLEMKIEVEAHRHARASLERLDELARSGLVRANKSRSAKISDSVSLAEQSRSVSGKASEGSKKKERVAPVVGSRTGSQGDRGTRAPATGESAESEKDGSRAKAGSAGERRDDPAAAVDRSRVRVVIILVRPAHDRSVERTPPPGPRPRRAP